MTFVPKTLPAAALAAAAVAVATTADAATLYEGAGAFDAAGPTAATAFAFLDPIDDGIDLALTVDALGEGLPGLTASLVVSDATGDRLLSDRPVRSAFLPTIDAEGRETGGTFELVFAALGGTEAGRILGDLAVTVRYAFDFASSDDVFGFGTAEIEIAGDLSPVPLPGGLPLLATGSLALAAIRRRRR